MKIAFSVNGEFGSATGVVDSPEELAKLVQKFIQEKEELKATQKRFSMIELRSAFNAARQLSEKATSIIDYKFVNFDNFIHYISNLEDAHV